MINSSRGGVVDNNALKNNLTAGTIGEAVLDVWENEPKIDVDLLGKCAIGTPHIAGYSIDGKVNATKMILKAFCEHFDLPQSRDFSSLISPPQPPVIEIDHPSAEVEDILAGVINHCYNIERDDEALRRITSVERAERGTFFKRLRSSYNFRHEFSNYDTRIGGESELLKEILVTFGFKVS